MIREDILGELKCGSSNEKHFLIEPISLNCGHSICKKCIPKDNIKELKCHICGCVSKQDFSKFQVSKGIQNLLKLCLEDVFKSLETYASLLLHEIKNNIRDKSELIEVKLKYIKDEIDIRVESLINQVIEVGEGMKTKLDKIGKDTLKSIQKEPQIKDLQLSLAELDENIKNKINFNEAYLDNFQKKIKGWNNLINEINAFEIPDFQISDGTINDESLIGNFAGLFSKFKSTKEVSFPENSLVYGMALVENNTKILITDFGRKLLHCCDLEGKIMKSWNPNNILMGPVGVCVLKVTNVSVDEKIFVGDNELHKIFAFTSNFEFLFRIKGENLKSSNFMKIDNGFDSSRLYALDWKNDALTIWNTNDGKFIDKVHIETPGGIDFTTNRLFVSSFVTNITTAKNKTIKINKGGNCIFEIDKKSFVLIRKITGSWYSPFLLEIEPSGNSHLVAKIFENSIIVSDDMCFLTLDENGKIIKKFELTGLKRREAVLLKNRVYILNATNLRIYEF